MAKGCCFMMVVGISKFVRVFWLGSGTEMTVFGFRFWPIVKLGPSPPRKELLQTTLEENYLASRTLPALTPFYRDILDTTHSIKLCKTFIY